MQLEGVSLGGSHRPRMANLFCPSGVWNGNPGDDFRMPNGSTIPSSSSEDSLFHYGMTCEWGFRVLGQVRLGGMESIVSSGLWDQTSIPCEGGVERPGGSAEDSGVVPDLSPPLPSHLRFSTWKRRQGQGWLSLTRVGISGLRSQKSLHPSASPSLTPRHIK